MPGETGGCHESRERPRWTLGLQDAASPGCQDTLQAPLLVGRLQS